MDNTNALAATENNFPKASESYYRSRLYTARFGKNRLLTAAQPLFSLLGAMAANEHFLSLTELQQNLSHEITVFSKRATAFDYGETVVTMTRNVLCMAIDECMAHYTWGQTENWQAFSLCQHFSVDERFIQHFFLLVEQLSADSLNHGDVLEFFYLCLCLGFKGEYRHRPKGQEELDTIMENLYQCIKRHQNEPWYNFLMPIKQSIRQQRAKHPIPLWLATTLSFTLLVTFYSGLNYILGVI